MNALILGAATNWCRNIEEEGIDENGYVPESARVRVTLLHVVPGENTALMGCVSVSGDTSKNRQEVVQWRE
jgi:hypothetical protein